jgi:hypothetical protein
MSIFNSIMSKIFGSGEAQATTLGFRQRAGAGTPKRQSGTWHSHHPQQFFDTDAELDD